MKLLILGGTRFVGRHLVAAGLARGHEVTLLNRGTHSSALPGVETIHGDRNSDLTGLQARRWDTVVDMCGYLPRAVRASAEVLSDSVERYVFISSQSAYADYNMRGIDESYPLSTLTDDLLEAAYKIDTRGEPSYGAMYGGLKALCEQAAEEVMPGRVLTIRPGLIVGPYDYSDRFTYWPVRVARGGEVLAPGRPERSLQFIDARDLAEWLVSMVGAGAVGAYNAVCPSNTVTMKDVLEECKRVSSSDAVQVTRGDAAITWVTEEFLRRENVAAWSDMPLWLPEGDAPELAGFMFINSSKAIAAGLQIRPLRETVADTLTWSHERIGDAKLKAGLDAEREQTLLRKWHERN